ncbi:MAG: galactokinase [Thermodesulfobacteriota bacterium]|nr:galactokinase [Thermodesulfobacteriota bacterium]
MADLRTKPPNMAYIPYPEGIGVLRHPYKKKFEDREVNVSVPCRIDLGGTLDISTFYLPLNHLKPSTFNIAIDMRTKVTLSPFKNGYIKVSSRGFDSAEFKASDAPFDHPMGLMFAVAKFFNAHGVHIKIDSSSPPRSALGGSSAAAVAIAAAFLSVAGKETEPSKAAIIAHYIESSVAGVPCGFQDQLAAAFGGVNQWHWKMGINGPEFTQEKISMTFDDVDGFKKNFVVAYCGIPHVSSDVNKKWVNGFISGKHRDKWEEIVLITKDFSNAVKSKDFCLAGSLMNRETDIRLSMTPDVLDPVGKMLYKAAKKVGCGARFTGAGGGGCLWAIGKSNDIKKVKTAWEDLLLKEDQAKLLDTAVDYKGILFTDN